MSDPKSTTYPHEDLMAENNIALTDLSASTQRKIEKFKKETDPDLKDSLDAAIYEDVDEVVEKKKKEAKSAEVKNKREEHKKKKASETTDVSKAPTATGATGGTETQNQNSGTDDGKNTQTPQDPPKKRGVMGTILGLGQ